jgi:hypothetical protein
MYIYFSTTGLEYGLKEAIIEMKIKNLLFSYYYRNNFDKWFDLIKQLDKPNVIIDSGAFSAWTLKKEIDRQSYLDFIYEVKRRYQKYCNNIYFVNLDSIPGEFGRKPTISEIENSAKKGLDNFLWFRSKKIETIHVYHQHERIEWLKKIMTMSNYIGISPANDLTTKQRMPWLCRCFYLVRNKVKTHCFGGTSKDILYNVPFYSADSSSYAMVPRRFTPRFNGLKLNKDIKVKKVIPLVKKKIKEEIARLTNIEREATKLWSLRGINYS